ncbi:MAG: hypothetical protein Aurels2KO_31370 [Aureliella sp.]
MRNALSTFQSHCVVRTIHPCVALLITVGLATLTGCQGQNSATPAADTDMAETNQQLLALGKAYHSFHLTNKKGPADWDEAMSSGDSDAIAALRDKGCLVAWGTRFKDATVGAANFVLAYLPSAEDEGGLVLLLDGNVLRADPERITELLEAQSEIGVPK